MRQDQGEQEYTGQQQARTGKRQRPCSVAIRQVTSQQSHESHPKWHAHQQKTRRSRGKVLHTAQIKWEKVVEASSNGRAAKESQQAP